MPRGREALNEFTEELNSASQALSEFQDGLSDAIDAANEAASGAAGGVPSPGADDGGRGASRAGREARKDRGLGAVAGRFAKRAAAGAIGGALFSAAKSIRGGTGISEGVEASIAAAAAFVVPGLGQKVDAAQLAGQRTAAITGPLARFGIEVRKEDRERQFEFENQLAAGEVKELAEVKTLTAAKQAQEGADALLEGPPGGTIGELERTGGQTVQILGRILDELTRTREEGRSKGGSPR